MYLKYPRPQFWHFAAFGFPPSYPAIWFLEATSLPAAFYAPVADIPKSPVPIKQSVIAAQSRCSRAARGAVGTSQSKTTQKKPHLSGRYITDSVRMMYVVTAHKKIMIYIIQALSYRNYSARRTASKSGECEIFSVRGYIKHALPVPHGSTTIPRNGKKIIVRGPPNMGKVGRPPARLCCRWDFDRGAPFLSPINEYIRYWFNATIININTYV